MSLHSIFKATVHLPLSQRSIHPRHIARSPMKRRRVHLILRNIYALNSVRRKIIQLDLHLVITGGEKGAGSRDTDLTLLAVNAPFQGRNTLE